MSRPERGRLRWPRQRQDRGAGDFRLVSFDYENSRREPRRWQADQDARRSARMQDDLKRAIRYLVSLVDYNSIASRTQLDTEADPIPVNSALADAFDYMGFLHGENGLRNARGVQPFRLFRYLRQEIPEQYLVHAGAERQRLQIRSWIPTSMVLALGSAAWIAELKQRKERALEFAGANVSRIRPRQETEAPAVGADARAFVCQSASVDQQTSERQVENYLDKIEVWFEQWEAGNVEWETMKDCVDME